MKLWLPLIIATFLISAFLLLTIYLFRHRWTHQTRTRRIWQNVSLSLFSTLYLFLVLEVVFASVFVQSDGYGFTLASKRWFQKYWNPINSLGYRDKEHVWRENKLFVIGDSFVAGHGIKNIDKRLSGILSKTLGDAWTVAVLAQNGWDSRKQYEALITHPQKPDKIIVSYYINDIEGAATAHDLHRPQLVEGPGKILRPFVKYSFVLNWVYWRLYRGKLGDDYWLYLRQAYNDQEIWQTHKKELSVFIDFSAKTGSGIIFLVWPNLRDISGSAVYTSKVTAYLSEKGVSFIDLGQSLQAKTQQELVVNNMDGHPNEQTHWEVAQLLYAALFPGGHEPDINIR